MGNVVEQKAKSIVEETGENSFVINLKKSELKSIFGTEDTNFIHQLIQNTIAPKVIKGKASGKDILTAHELFKNLKPSDEIECLLIAQIMSADALASEFMKRALNPEQTFIGVDANSQRYSKGVSSMCRLVDTLIKYKRGGEQKVTVEHISIGNGSQAIIGNIKKS
jgi:hypothetical protein